jgi:hypothetical protein
LTGSQSESSTPRQSQLGHWWYWISTIRSPPLQNHRECRTWIPTAWSEWRIQWPASQQLMKARPGK